jgi:ArsR family transcriptional regulator, arsenate/arsenite/antimonite-responsive transcriptional repressor
MNAENAVRIFKALADRSRLLIASSLIEKPSYVEELSEGLALAPSTVSFHLKKLEEAGLVESVKEQYYVVYTLRRDLLEQPLIEMLSLEGRARADQAERLRRYRQKVLKTFLRRGKLIKIPVQRKKRRVILEEIAKRFDPGQRYPEREVNLVIADFHDDFCTLRRDMIAEKIMSRSRNTYWLRKAPEEHAGG